LTNQERSSNLNVIKNKAKIDDQKEYRDSILHREPGW